MDSRLAYAVLFWYTSRDFETEQPRQKVISSQLTNPASNPANSNMLLMRVWSGCLARITGGQRNA